ncbi:MAG TPA: hypothetical protein VH637_11480 [Streptosporangiaceae bacterium]|jgi:hypothetical protein
MGFTAPMTAQGGNPAATPSWGAANLISYRDSDFEGGVGDWAGVSNSTLSDSGTAAFLHDDSLRAVAGTSGTQQFKLGAAAGQINVTGGDSYRVGAWVKAPAASGRTLTWAMGFYTSGGSWLGWTSAPARALSASGSWQYVSGVISAPATAGYAFGSPRATETGVAAGEALNMDEVLVEPARAATLIGAHGNTNDNAGYTAADSAIGPLQTYKVFYPGALPARYAGSICSTLPASVTCLISYKTMNTNVASFVGSIPAGKPVILIYYQEPEHNTFSFQGKTGGPAFVAEFETQSNLIRGSAGDAPNITVAMDAGTYQYVPGTNHDLGASCGFIPPSQYVDMYLADHYEPAASGNNLATDSASKAEWNTWLGCANAQHKPIGIAEYGLNCNGANPAPNAASTAAGIAADNTYLKGQPDGLPVLMWAYWYDNNVTCNFTKGGAPDGTQAVSQWKSIETQNGGGAH